MMPTDYQKKMLSGLGAALLLTALPLSAEVTLLPKGDKTLWKYLDTGSIPGKDWTEEKFDDAAWKKGKAPLGYGETGLGTTLSFGLNPKTKPLTVWFRTSFRVESAEKEKLEKLSLRLRRDDGAIIYLNGKEAGRSNLPDKEVAADTPAASAVDQDDETRIHEIIIPASLLAAGGINTVAVEVHQAYAGSSDLYLDLEIAGLEAGEAPVRDFYKEGMTAASRGDLESAVKLLAQMDPAHPAYVKTMAVLGWEILAERLGRPADGLPFVRKAYEKAPADRDVVRAYIRTHVLSGVLFRKEGIARVRPGSVPPEFAFLVTKPQFGDTSPSFTRAQLEEDLDYLEHVLERCFAYLELRPVDYRAALDSIRISLDDRMPVNSFEICVAKLISLFCDGHARTEHHESQFLPSGYAPFQAGSYKGRVYLGNPAGNGFLDPAHPWLVSIDGKPVAEWMKVAGYLVVKESPQWHLRGTLELLPYITYLRAELGLPQKKEIALTLTSDDGKKSRDMTVNVQPRPPRPVRFPRGESREIDGIGYLRVQQMSGDPRLLAAFDQRMEEYRDTKGLIIDLRGNTGGTKNILLTLFPYFMKPGDPMRIVELSTYRLPMPLPHPNPSGFMMSGMSAQTIGSSHWKSDAERKQVSEFIAKFTPEWKLPAGKFSEWHVLGLDSEDNPAAYYYDKPLIILQDSSSFSASDIFIGAFEDHPHTTQIGMPSGGGNGWMESYQLPNTGLGFVLCQSAKFRPNGKLYDGVGIPPDVQMEATPDDIFGKSDTVLDAAVQRLEAGSAEPADTNK